MIFSQSRPGAKTNVASHRDSQRSHRHLLFPRRASRGYHSYGLTTATTNEISQWYQTELDLGPSPEYCDAVGTVVRSYARIPWQSGIVLLATWWLVGPSHSLENVIPKGSKPKYPGDLAAGSAAGPPCMFTWELARTRAPRRNTSG